MRLATSLMSTILGLILAAPALGQRNVAAVLLVDAKQELPAEAPLPKKKGKEGFQAAPEKKDAKPQQRVVFTAPARRVAVQPAANANDQQKALLQQWRQQLRPLLTSELNFARQVCEIPLEKRPQIRAAGEKSLDAEAARVIQEQQGRRAGEQTSISQNMQRELGKALQAALPPDEYDRYQQELKARTQQRKRATILSLVAKLEEALSLDVEQRNAIIASFESKWEDAWDNWLVISRYGENYFPQIPDEVVTPHLSEAQKTLWSYQQKIQFGSFSGVMSQPTDDVAWWGAAEAPPPVGPPDAVPPAAANKDAVEKDAKALGEVLWQVFGLMFNAGKK